MTVPTPDVDPEPMSLVEREESTLWGALGMARARYEALVIAVDEAQREGRDIYAQQPRRRRQREAEEPGPSFLVICDDEGLPIQAEYLGRTLAYEPAVRRHIADEIEARAAGMEDAIFVSDWDQAAVQANAADWVRFAARVARGGTDA